MKKFTYRYAGSSLASTAVSEDVLFKRIEANQQPENFEIFELVPMSLVETKTFKLERK